MCDTSNALVRSLVIWDHLSPERGDSHAFISANCRYSYQPRKDERLSWPRWLVIPRWFTQRRSPIQVLTGPDVDRDQRATTKSGHHPIIHFRDRKRDQVH